MFLETPRFPDDISYGSSGGPSFLTTISMVKSGFETRNQKWVQSRGTYDAAFGILRESQLTALISFFQVMAGQANGFRFKDWGDYKSCALDEAPASSDQALGLGDSTDGTDGTASFQIVKTYSQGIMSRVRDINKTVESTVLVEVDGVLKTEGVHYNIDNTTGIVTFTAGNVPVLDSLDDGSDIPEVIKCGYEYDVPCRFNSDELSVTFDAYVTGSASVPIIEIRIT